MRIIDFSCKRWTYDLSGVSNANVDGGAQYIRFIDTFLLAKICSERWGQMSLWPGLTHLKPNKRCGKFMTSSGGKVDVACGKSQEFGI